MRILCYRRIQCKYDFIVASDDSELLKSYEQLYLCDKIPTVRVRKGTDEENFQEIYGYIQNTQEKEFCCAYYIKKAYAVFYKLPGSKKIQKIGLRATAGAGCTDALQAVENLMYLTLIPKDNVVGLHGAAVAKGDTAFLLLAKTSSGKSTLTSFLCLSGYQYITDDEIFISQETLKLQPVYKKLSLRPQGYNILQDTFKNTEGPAKILDEAACVKYGAIHSYLLDFKKEDQYREYKIGGIIFLAGYSSREPYFKRLDGCEGFINLLKGQLSITNDRRCPPSVPETYKALIALSKITYEMRYAELWTAETYLRHLRL